MMALIDAAAEHSFPAEIAGVICDRPDAAGLGLAKSRGVPTFVIERGSHADKGAHDAAIDAALTSLGAEIVALAGYMRLLTTPFVDRWRGRMINIHPALLPGFKGLDTHAAALASGVRIHGCTVHFVTPQTDDGPIIAQAAVPVHLEDTEQSLAARVLKAEHQLYPMALRMVAEGKARMRDGRTVFTDTGSIIEAGVALFSPSAIRDEVDFEALARFTP
jgi:formyltetrahydrofolate-dependent phosphoribosylglycinamide formyltransferase